MSCWRGIQTRFVSTLLFKHTSCKSRHVINCHPQQLRYFFLTWLGVHWWGNKQTLLHVESCGGSLLVWGSSPVAVMMMCVIISHLPGEIILRPNKASDLLMQQKPWCMYLFVHWLLTISYFHCPGKSITTKSMKCQSWKDWRNWLHWNCKYKSSLEVFALVSNVYEKCLTSWK